MFAGDGINYISVHFYENDENVNSNLKHMSFEETLLVMLSVKLTATLVFIDYDVRRHV